MDNLKVEGVGKPIGLGAVVVSLLFPFYHDQDAVVLELL